MCSFGAYGALKEIGERSDVKGAKTLIYLSLLLQLVPCVISLWGLNQASGLISRLNEAALNPP